MRAVAGRPAKVRFRFEAEDGTLTNVDDETTVTVTVTAGDGSPLATGTADRESDGIYAYALAAQSQLDVLTATAVGTVGGADYTITETVQLVDRRFMPLSVMRADPALAALSLVDFLRVVDAAEDAITTELNFSPVLAGARVEWRSRECVRLFVPGIYYPQEAYALSVNDVDQLTGDDIRVRDNAFERGWGYAYGTPFYDPLLGVAAVPFLPGVWKAWLSHGWTATPSDLGDAALLLARHYAQVGAGTAYPDRATRIMTEASEIWLARPGTDAPFGLPEVDAAVCRHRMPEPLADDPGAF